MSCVEFQCMCVLCVCDSHCSACSQLLHQLACMQYKIMKREEQSQHAHCACTHLWHVYVLAFRCMTVCAL